MKKCKYCDKPLTDVERKYKEEMCFKCNHKYGAVKKLCAIFEEIKKASGKYG